MVSWQEFLTFFFTCFTDIKTFCQGLLQLFIFDSTNITLLVFFIIDKLRSLGVSTRIFLLFSFVLAHLGTFVMHVYSLLSIIVIVF